MLVLSRKKNEVICIGDNIRVMVVGVQGEKVRLAIDAPRHVIVDRLEIAIAKGRATSGGESSSQERQEA